MPVPAVPVGTAMLAGTAMQALGGLFSGFAQGKVSEQQLEQARLQYGLSREQFEFMKQQSLRQNQIGQENTNRVSPLMMQMLSRSRENMSLRPDPVRLAPPNINNRYQPGVGSAGNPAPPPTPAMPWLNNGGGGGGDGATQVPIGPPKTAPAAQTSLPAGQSPTNSLAPEAPQMPGDLMARMEMIKRIMAQRGAQV